MKAKGLSLQAASDYIGEYYKELMEQYLTDKAHMPSFSDTVDGDVTRYITALQNWPIGYLEWSFETVRYFGPRYSEAKRTRLITLKPTRREYD